MLNNVFYKEKNELLNKCYYFLGSSNLSSDNMSPDFC